MDAEHSLKLLHACFRVLHVHPFPGFAPSVSIGAGAFSPCRTLLHALELVRTGTKEHAHRPGTTGARRPAGLEALGIDLRSWSWGHQGSWHC